MEKQQADYLMNQYIKPIYGFALSKTSDTSKAEELAASIVSEVYSVLLSKDDILCVKAYIYRIARNVYARYYHDLKMWQGKVDISETNLASNDSIEDGLLQSEDHRLLRREITYLSEQRRKIIIAYFYENKKITEIAEENNLSEGTVKWHLFECKKELKKGMENLRNIGNLGLNPIKFGSMGHCGSPGTKGDTSEFLSKSITQNVAYSCYFEPHSINEIADELGVSPIFVSDEVSELTEYGFMDRLPGNRYQTNILITNYSKQCDEEVIRIYQKYSILLIEKYFSKLLTLKNEIETLPLYYTDQDYNFLLWTLIIYMAQKLHFKELETVKFEDVAVHRPDGGYYIAQATVQNKEGSGGFLDRHWYTFLGYMTREDTNIKALKLSVYWNGEPLDWRTNVKEDYKLLYHFLKGTLPQDERNIDSYEMLINKGYLIKTDEGYKANIVYIPNLETKAALDAILPKPGRDILEIGKALDEQIYKIRSAGQPKHMLKTIKLIWQNSLQMIHVFVMKSMLDNGLLQLPTEKQRKQICNLLIAEV